MIIVLNYNQLPNDCGNKNKKNKTSNSSVHLSPKEAGLDLAVV